MAYVPILEQPFRNITKLPKALMNLPINAVLHQSWGSIFSIFAILLVMALPTFSFLIYTASLFVAGPDTTKAGIGVTFVILIILGIAASFVYMKYIYGSLNSLMESRKAPWLVEKIRKKFSNNYQRGWNKRLLIISFILPLLMEIPLILLALSQLNFNVSIVGVIIWGIFLVEGHFGISLLMFVSIMSYRFININTVIYDQVLSTIIDRVHGYTEGHESILNKKNYEVVGVLSDTPGLSIRNLGDIPVFGLGTGIFSVNALIFLLFSPLLLYPPVADYISSNFGTDLDQNGLNIVIVMGIAVSSIASFGAVITPLIRITRVMGKFKNKALTELDPFIFEEITGVALRKDTKISNETQVLFMIRNYIYTMKVSPVNPFRLVQIVGLAIVYGWRILPLLIGAISALGGI